MKTIILILSILCTHLISSAQITANFNTEVNEGCGSLAVTFNNTSQPETGLSYYWNFGNGFTSNLKNPVTAYLIPGHYTVILVVSDGITNDTMVKNDFIVVHSKPSAGIEISGELSGCVPHSVQFTDNTIPGSGDIILYHWDFGDGTNSNIRNPEHAFLYQSQFMVSLSVTDEHNCTDGVIFENLISAYKPQANFMGDPRNSCMSELEVEFYNNSVGIEPLSFQWNFGDGTFSNQSNPLHTYHFNGVYDIQLITTDAMNCNDTMIRDDYIALSGAQAQFSVERDTLCIDEKLRITNTSLNAVSYHWDFGDGTNSTSETPSHSYNLPGNYPVTLTVTHELGCTDTYTVQIHVEQVIADFELPSEFSCSVPVTIPYENLSVNASAYIWKFGSGGTSVSFEPEVTYTKTGVFTDTLIAISSHGCRSVKVLSPAFTVNLPRAYFSPNPFVNPNELKGCAPLTVNFENHSLYDTPYDQIADYYWMFGDVSSSNEENPVHVYDEVGKFIVQFWFTTELGCSSTPYFAEVRTGTLQHADFIKNTPDTICASQPVQLFDKSQDSTLINEWYWRFGDGSMSFKQNPVHFYTDTGFMEVKLQSYYNGCGDAETKSKFIYVKGPYTDIKYSIDCENPYYTMFQPIIIDADSLYWNFGDGSPNEVSTGDIGHLYPENMEYFVTMTAVNSSNNCDFTDSYKILIKDIQAVFDIDKDLGCKMMTVQLNSSKSVDVEPDHFENGYGKYNWDFGDGTNLITNLDKITHKYTSRGTFPLKLTVRDFRGCRDSLIKLINVFDPEPDFSILSVNGCIPSEAAFENITLSDTTIVSWLWEFGDGTVSNLESPVHTYFSSGFFDVSLKATDALGCHSTIFKEDFIELQKPIPDFFVNDQHRCLGDTVLFVPADTVNVSNYIWDFGDGTFSNEVSPKHLYTTSGTYNVTLSLTDFQGCDSTLTKNQFISIQDIPIVDFQSLTTISDCYPVQLLFEDQTLHPEITDWLWNFGDGQTSSHLKNPQHVYTLPGKYDLSLRVYTSNGCTSELTREEYIHIKGPHAKILAADTVCRNIQTLFIAEDKLDVYKLEWIFGDGANAFNDSVYHAYDKIGFVYPSLLLKSDSISTCDIIIQDTVYIPMLIPEINLEDNQSSGCVPFILNAFTESSDVDFYQWDTNDGTFLSGQSISYAYHIPGNYQLKLTIGNNFGCSDSISVEINVFGLPNVEADNDTLICRGESLLLTASGAMDYEWYPKQYLNELNPDNPITKPDSTIIYQVVGTDLNGCINSDEITVTVQQIPTIELSDTAVIIGEAVVLDASSYDINSWFWSPDYEITCTDCPIVTVIPLEPTYYDITVTDTANCFSVTKSIFIDIIKAYTVDIPSAFTPNGDGINDKLFVKGWGMKELIVFKVYNRFGELVFETDDKYTGWDGSYKGKKQGVETFTYYVEVKTYEDQILSKKGTVKILK